MLQNATVLLALQVEYFDALLFTFKNIFYIITLSNYNILYMSAEYVRKWKPLGHRENIVYCPKCKMPLQTLVHYILEHIDTSQIQSVFYSIYL